MTSDDTISIMPQTLSYKVEYALDKETGMVTAVVPELNHVSSYGDSFAAAEANIREAAMGYLEVLTQENRSVPRPVFQTEGTYLRLLLPRGFKTLHRHAQTRTSARSKGHSKTEKSRLRANPSKRKSSVS